MGAREGCLETKLECLEHARVDGANRAEIKFAVARDRREVRCRERRTGDEGGWDECFGL